MGACQSHIEYYFGFINVSVSHLDVLSFFLGVVCAVAAQAVWGWFKRQKQASKHILRGATAHKWAQGGGKMEMRDSYLPYGFTPGPWMMPPAGQAAPTAPAPMPPPPASTALVPWKMSGEMSAREAGSGSNIVLCLLHRGAFLHLTNNKVSVLCV